ncbi:nucleotidyltransferase domain-containing protein [Thermococcus gammatolerans]|uniref:Nucleotidyltransferase, putative n=1 Tax=Thermococcus gammatolerans (strain DSM 15229 / JCM 11827 / EJ3) TaxID=593117 RepID=C5A4H3_THEGJ|nr:nucleotidyltransferase domain-containing protein [Thermococcus gammatolerans]ACS33135.1 Nucleotidyltransferase, putative [Thermococcus gammatolerans EJ3]
MTSTTSTLSSEPLQFFTLQGTLHETVKNFVENHSEVFDVVLYGSTVLGKEKPNDLDLMILTRTKLPALELRNLILELKRELSKILTNAKLDIRAMSLEELFDPNNLASLGVIIEGFSLTKNKSMAELMNGKAYALFRFTLEGLPRKDRVRFQYALKGRDMKSGLLKELNGEQWGAWVVVVPIEHTYRFRDFLELWGVKYEAFTILKGADLFYKF